MCLIIKKKLNNVYNCCRNVYFNRCLLLLFLHLIQEINCAPPDLTFIINKTNDSKIVSRCIAEGDVLNSAITWIYPLVDTIEKLPSIVSNFLPTRNSEYNCNFGRSKPCNKIWQMNGWQSSAFDAHSFKPIIDSRWENFPTYLTSNLTEEFNARVDVPSVFEIGVSIRATKNAEIFICEGWNPKFYPCYYVNIGSSDNKLSFLRKYKNGIPDKFSKNDTKLAKFKHEVGALFADEWKTFSLSFSINGTLELNDYFNNLTILSYTDKSKLKPISVTVRSKNEMALWKIHKNEYIFTNKSNVTKFGPELNLYGSQLCLSLHVSLCKYCSLRFFMFSNEEKKILKEIIKNNGSDNVLWEDIKLIQNGIFESTIQLYVETYYTKNMENTYGFWAIDDVRVCLDNEIKITQLELNMDFQTFEKSHVTCQALMFPMWRPIHQIASNTLTEDVVCNTSTSTSIQLRWNPPVENAVSPEYSIVQYEGNDICKYDVNNKELQNMHRKKSQGYVIGKSTSIDIENLVPYTLYTINFWNIIDNNTKYFEMSTLPTNIPTKEEIPRDVKMIISDTTNTIEWKKPDCNVLYGPLVFQIYVKNRNANESRHYLDVTSKYKLDNLQPFTNYTIQIETSRKMENFNKTNLYLTTIHNFTTLPGVAPRVNNLELYCSTKRSASLRFDLPENCRGVPSTVQIRLCHPLFLSKCITQHYNLTNCQLWESKYCVDIDKLLKNEEYEFHVSIKNEGTFMFSSEESVKVVTIERVPGKPSSIMYTMIQCGMEGVPCNLNISWDHPYVQNGSITMFEIILEETSYSFAADASNVIHEVLKIDRNNYQKRYHCIVKYVTYNTPYKIAIRAINDVHKGEFEYLFIKTKNIDTYVSQTPEFIKCTNETMTFKLPKSEQLNSSTLIVIVQDYDESKTEITDDIVKLELFDNKYKLCNDFGNTWVTKTLTLSRKEEPLIVIGDYSSSYIPQLKKIIINKPLKPDTEYCFTFALINQYENTERIEVYHSKHLYTQRNSIAEQQIGTTNVAAYVVPILIGILLIGCAVWFINRHFSRRRRMEGEHIYETMPFDDYMPDAVSNENYDRLVHN